MFFEKHISKLYDFLAATLIMLLFEYTFFFGYHFDEHQRMERPAFDLLDKVLFSAKDPWSNMHKLINKVLLKWVSAELAPNVVTHAITGIFL